MNTNTWILVADSATARVFEALTPEAPLRKVLQLGHPDSRDHARDLGSDRPGRGHGSVGSARYAMEPPTDPTVVQAQRFAAELGALLRQHRLEGAYGRLYLVAPPAFLGQLRKALDDDTQALVVHTLHKELAMLSDTEVRAHLPEHL